MQTSSETATRTARRPQRPTARTGKSHQRQPNTGGARAETDRSAGVERRRRARRFRQRRRDLLADAVLATVLAVTALIVAPGLGVIAIASIPVVLALVGTIVVDRRRRGRRRPAGRRRST